MTNPQFINEENLALADVKEIMKSLEKRDDELNYRTNKAKEFFEQFDNILSKSKKNELLEKLKGLDLTRLREEHMLKIIDFLPTTANDLKVVLQAYPLSLSKKDQDTIVGAVNGFAA